MSNEIQRSRITAVAVISALVFYQIYKLVKFRHPFHSSNQLPQLRLYIVVNWLLFNCSIKCFGFTINSNSKKIPL